MEDQKHLRDGKAMCDIADKIILLKKGASDLTELKPINSIVPIRDVVPDRKTRLDDLNHGQLQQVYFQFHSHCTGCVNMISYLSKRNLIALIKETVPNKNINQHFKTFNYE